MIELHIKLNCQDSITNRKWDHHCEFTRTRKKNNLIPICIVGLWANEWISFIPINNENPSADRLKWNWVDLPGWGQQTQMPPQSNLTPAWTPCVSSIWFDSSRCSRGVGGRNLSPLMAHSRVTVWKVHFDPWRQGSSRGQSCPANPPPTYAPSQRLFDLSDDPWTLSMSVMSWLLQCV